MSATQSADRQDAQKSLGIGWRDQSRLLDPETLTEGDDEKGTLFTTTRAGQDAVRDQKVRAFVDVPADYAKSGTITVYLPPARGSVFSRSSSGDSSLVPTIRRALLKNRVSPALLERIVDAPEISRLNYNSRSKRFEETNPLEALSRFAIPYVFSLLLIVAVLFSSSYLLHGIVEEKENRVMEVLLSAASHEDLLLGKLIGLGGAGIAQFGLWIATGSIGGFVALQFMRQLAPFAVSPSVAAVGMLMFLLGFALYAALMAGIGSFGTSWRESQQISGMLVLFLVIPLMLLPVFLESPNGTLPRLLSLFPMTAPIALMLRVAAGGASVGEVGLTIALLAVSVVFVVRLSAKLFHLSLLMYGQRPSFGEIMRWLRAA